MCATADKEDVILSCVLRHHVCLIHRYDLEESSAIPPPTFDS